MTLFLESGDKFLKKIRECLKQSDNVSIKIEDFSRVHITLNVEEIIELSSCGNNLNYKINKDHKIFPVINKSFYPVIDKLC